jgi:predicted TIM-barrel fold metal-dependent hydrolase
MIIDTHCHLGVSKLSGRTITDTKLIDFMDRNEIDLALVMPHAVTDDPLKAHEDVADLCRRFPKRFRGIANFSPLLDEGEYCRVVTRFVHEHGFVALKT